MELVDRYDNKRRKLDGKIERYNEKSGEYSQVVHLWIQNDRGEFLFQKRSMKKRVYPGKWSVTGGASDAGETTLDALKRECKEEIGIEIDINNVELVMSIKRPRVFMDIYLARQNVDIKDVILQETEVDEVKWLSQEEIRELIKNDMVGSSMKIYYDLFIKLIEE